MSQGLDGGVLTCREPYDMEKKRVERTGSKGMEGTNLEDSMIKD